MHRLGPHWNQWSYAREKVRKNLDLMSTTMFSLYTEPFLLKSMQCFLLSTWNGIADPSNPIIAASASSLWVLPNWLEAMTKTEAQCCKVQFRHLVEEYPRFQKTRLTEKCYLPRFVSKALRWSGKRVPCPVTEAGWSQVPWVLIWWFLSYLLVPIL